MGVDPLRFFDMPILARLALVEGAIHDIMSGWRPFGNVIVDDVSA